MALWTPSQILPHTWIDFSDTATLFDATSGGSVVTNGVGIARAEDKSGNGRHFTQATSGSRFTWTSGVQNGLGVARGDGGDWLTTTAAKSVYNFLHQTAATIFVVNKNGTSSNPLALCSWFGNNGSGSGNIGLYCGYDDRGLLTGLEDAFNLLCSNGTTGQGVYRTNDATGTFVFTDFRNAIPPNVFGVATLRSDPTNATAANRLKVAMNGGSLLGNQTFTLTPSGSNSTFDLQIGTLGNNVFPFLGDYCELVIFNSLLSTTNQQLMEGYLAWKWGIQSVLPSNHPYKNGWPSVGGSRRKFNASLVQPSLFNGSLIG